MAHPLSQYGKAWLAQTKALFYKNVRVLVRSRTLFLLFALFAPALGPIASSLIYGFAKSSISWYTDPDSLTKEVLPIKIPSCDDTFCPMIAFSPNTEKYQGIMKILSEAHGFNFGSDVRGFNSAVDIAAFFLQDSSSLSRRPFVAGVAFDASGLSRSENDTLKGFYTHSKSIAYKVLHFPNGFLTNALRQPNREMHQLAGVQVAVDQAILSHSSGKSSPIEYTANYQWVNASIPENRKIILRYQYDYGSNFYGDFIQSYLNSIQTLVSTCIQTFFFIPVMSLALSVVSGEKRKKLLAPLRRMGLIESAYWTAIYVPMIIISVMVGCFFMIGSVIASKALSMELFAKVDMGIQFVTSFTFSLAMTAYGLLISSALSRSLFVNIAQGFIVIAVIVCNLVIFMFPSNEPYWITLKATGWGKFLTLIFPWVSFGEIWMDQVNVVNPTVFNNFTTGLTYNNTFFNSHPTNNSLTGRIIANSSLEMWQNSPTGSFHTGWMVLSAVLFLVLSWYLNQALTTEEGFFMPWNFFITASYWSGQPTIKRKEQIRGDFIENVRLKSKDTDTVYAVKLSKIYKTTSAVKELSLTLEKGKVYALLGHNGCGKTTTVNMLSGVTTPTFGHAFIFGYDVYQEISAIRPLMGCCTQSDFLYNWLTAAEHVAFFASFRNCNVGESLSKYVDDKLEQVELLDAKNRTARGFSGGMKRRLSLILSTIGDGLKIYFLDEPTTGLDPLSRRNAWRVIENLKKHAIVILTTHSMEEADNLADHISIMHQGQIRAMGSSLFLKGRYGNGYQISVMEKQGPMKLPNVAQPSHQELEKWLMQVLPGSELVSSAAGCVTITIGKQSTAYLKEFLRLLQNEQGLDWGISNSTLEEVFLKLCAQNKGINEVVKKEIPVCRLCNIRNADICTLFTATGIKVTVEGIVCEACATGVSKPALQTAPEGQYQMISFDLFKEAFQERLLIQKNESLEKQAENAMEIKAARTSNITLSQMKAVLVKNARLDWKMKKTNICIVILVLALNIGFGIIASLVMARSSSFQETLEKGCKGTFSVDYRTRSCNPEAFLNGSSRNGGGSWGSTSNIFVGQQQPAAGFKETPIQSSWSSTVQSFTDLFQLLPVTNEKELRDEFAAAMKARITFLQDKEASSVVFKDTLDGRLSNKSSDRYFYTQFDTFATIENLKQLLIKHPNLTELPTSCGGYSTMDKVGDTFNRLKGIRVSDSVDFFHQINKLYPDVILRMSKFKSGQQLAYDIARYRDGQGDVPPTLFHVTSGKNNTGDVCYFTSKYPKYYYSSYYSVYSDGVPNNGFLAYTINQMSNSFYDQVNAIQPSRAFNESATTWWEFSGTPNPFPRNNSILTQYLPLSSIDGGEAQSMIYLSIIFCLIILFSTFFMMPRLVLLWSTERTDNLADMMRIQGLSPSLYWMTNYIYGFILNGVLCLITFIVGLAAGSSLFQTAPGVIFLIFVLWAHTLVCMGLLLSSVFKKPITAGLLSFIIYVAVAVLSALILLSAKPTTAGLEVSYGLFPPFGFVSAITMTISGIPHPPTLIYTILVWICSSSVMGAMGLVIHLLKPSGMGASPLRAWLDRFNQNKNTTANTMDADIEKTEKWLDQNVVDEQDRISRQDANNDYSDDTSAVRLSRLRKVFGEKQVGVKDLSLDIKFGETFGLLGPNGAGKSTAISCFTGLTHPMSGSIRIAGQDILSMKRKWDYIGVCPQMDIVWPDLTIEEHLLFYCGLRGIPSDQLHGAARRIAQDVGLDGDPFRQLARQMSGGMKRRLSIAIALTADPRIVVLDEPSTGLDPETRRSIWKIIDQIGTRKDRSVIITTHSMEEADALCDRIGIVCGGKLRVLGNQMYLKNKFGDGLKLTLRLSFKYTAQDKPVQELDKTVDIPPFTTSHLQLLEESIKSYEESQLKVLDEMIKQDAKEAHCYYKSSTHYHLVAATRNAQQETEWDMTVKYAVSQGLDVLTLFDMVEKLKTALTVSDWSISETTLDDVFITVAEQFR